MHSIRLISFIVLKKKALVFTWLYFSSKTSVSLLQPRDERFWAGDDSAEGRNEAGDLRIQN